MFYCQLRICGLKIEIGKFANIAHFLSFSVHEVKQGNEYMLTTDTNVESVINCVIIII